MHLISQECVGKGQEYALESIMTATCGTMPKFFGLGTGLVEGAYHIGVDSIHNTVRHAPRPMHPHSNPRVLEEPC